VSARREAQYGRINGEHVDQLNIDITGAADGEMPAPPTINSALPGRQSGVTSRELNR